MGESVLWQNGKRIKSLLHPRNIFFHVFYFRNILFLGPLQHGAFLDIRCPNSPAVTVTWTYRDSKLVNLPWNLLVEGDCIVLGASDVAPANIKQVWLLYVLISFKNDVFNIEFIVLNIAFVPLFVIFIENDKQDVFDVFFGCTYYKPNQQLIRICSFVSDC